MYSIILFALSVVTLFLAIYFTLLSACEIVFKIVFGIIQKESIKVNYWFFIIPAFWWAFHYLLNIIMWYE